ncbi:MAG: C25 family cysteine peptidase [Candidatus Eisenbacteria bacterium]
MKRLALLTAALLLVAVPGFAEKVTVGAGGEELAVRVLESSGQTILLEFEIGAFERSTVDIAGEPWNLITLPGESPIEEAGMPDLPHVARSVIIPDDAKMEIRVVSSSYEEIHGVPVAPSKGVFDRTNDPADVPYTFDPFYAGDQWYPRDLVWARDPYILRDFRGLCVVAQPFQYNPATQTLRIYTQMVVEVTTSGAGEINVLEANRRDRMNAEFYQIYRDHFLNFSETRYAPVGEVGEMLIVSDGAFMAEMQPMVDWKNQMGVKTTMVDVSTIGNNSTAIKNYIQGFYNTRDLAFVLLVGDLAQIATPTYAGGESDPSYALLAGTDSYPEIFVGRFSASTVSHVQTQVARTVTYERDPMPAGDWYHRGVGIASNQGPGDDGEYDNVHIGNIRTDLLGFTYTLVDGIYDPYGTAAQVTTALNQGRSIINYCGHGSTLAWSSTGFSVSHVNSLVNNNMLPFIFSVACVNGDFSYGACFAEAWLRATNGSTPTGAIAMYASSINQSWNSPMCGQDEMNDLLVAEAKRTMGGLAFNGSCRMMDEYGADGINMFRTWIIFGDPSVRVRTDTPSSLAVTHADNIEPDATAFEVSVAGVPGALCALSYNGAYFGSAFTDGGGSASISVVGTLPEGEDLTLTVTSFNAIPFITTVPVESSISCDPYLSSIAVNDDLVLSPDGSGDSTMTIVVTLLDGAGLPLAGVPGSAIQVTASGVSSLGKDIIFCGSGSGTAVFSGDAPTDADGRCVIEVTNAGGCGTVDLTCSVGSVTLAGGASAEMKSPDFTGDGEVNFFDTFLFLPALNAGTGYCGNLNNSADGVVNFFDTAKYLSFLAAAAQCP